MLKGINPLLHGDLLSVLDKGGHASRYVLADANLSCLELEPLMGVFKIAADTPTALKAILSVLPLDPSVKTPVMRMKPDDEPKRSKTFKHHVQQEVDNVLHASEGKLITMGSIARLDFYQTAKKPFAVIQTTDLRPWGCFILQKGVVLADNMPVTKQGAHAASWRAPAARR